MKKVKSAKAKVEKPAPKHVTKVVHPVHPAPKRETLRAHKPAEQALEPTLESAPGAYIGVIDDGQHVPGQVEIPAVTPQNKAASDAAIPPAEGNNIGSVRDRAHADTPPANLQAPVEKTFVSPPDSAG